jgi:O-antigen/teichoic acid export membrane protein
MLKKIISIYIWRFLALFFNLASIFIVVPFLSNNKELYGLYLLCTAMVLFLTYSDLGFVGAGQKFAAEEYAKNNFLKEAEIIGFTSFVLLCASILFSLFMFFLSCYPHIFIKNLNITNSFTASRLYLILGIFTPINILLQRIITNILVIRLKDYISYRIEIFFNLIKILSVFYFFKNKYLLVEYFLFIQIVSLISSLVTILIIRKTENYNFIYLFKNIRFNIYYYNVIKKLALSTMLTTLAWVIYFELDLVYISKFFGPKQVAIYGVAFTFLNFSRTLWNNVFSPFAVPFNHLVAIKNYEDLKKLFNNLIFYTFPISVIVTLSLFLISHKFVNFWVGNDYQDSIIILQILISTSGFGFIIQPASFYFIATLKYKILFFLSLLLPIIFLLTALITVPVYGVIGFAISKSVALFFTFCISFYFVNNLVDHDYILKSWSFILLIFTTLSMIFLPLIVNTFFTSTNKSSTELFKLVIFTGIYIIISIFTIFLVNKKSRLLIITFFKNFQQNKYYTKPLN